MKIKLQTIAIPIIYLILFLVVNYFRGDLNFFDLFIFSFGTLMGTVLMDLDELILYKYYLLPDDKNIKLITRSLVFIISLLPLGLFLVTSTGSESGVGLFLGIITILLYELIIYRNNIDLFHERFLSQLKRKLSKQEIKYFVSGFCLFTFVFILFTFFLGR
ncbi:hypothetical protein KA111_02600 [Candidatus Woesebacteria bacterium]|nr:hypothetical protein [Candidatus Woesebacteria bacterium]